MNALRPRRGQRAAASAPPPPPPVASTIVITRAELNTGQLRIEGTGAKPNAAMTVNGQALGTAGSGTQ